MKQPKAIAQKPVLHHVTPRTTRLQEIIDWYEAVVGHAPNFTFEGAAWTTNDTANHRIAFPTTPGVKDDPDKITHSGILHLMEVVRTEYMSARIPAPGKRLPAICVAPRPNPFR
ncbi:VOC family protein [Paracoccus onubensis]|uniref:Uncharacterized protein n=1 Tax=Paracoccus onubensis TaxID=1675788 RepID=A0A418SMB5_9RHOB|nr:hypothetical protein [Paracoccus onubensis]RJE82081.1 hypothetical protein D3P04_21730 [Paracoccus onubensis]